MKKFLHLTLVAFIGVTFFSGCTQQAKWNHNQRQEMREKLREYRQAAYLNDLTDAEFSLFTDDVTLALEQDYPVYTNFIQMPGVNDTVQVYVVTTIVKELNADAHNMRHIFPYSYLVGRNILPAGLDRSQQHAFYSCLANKVDNYYPTMTQFVDALMADTTNMSQIARFQQQCANDLFDWTVVINEDIVAY